jgi:hypothetical protein
LNRSSKHCPQHFPFPRRKRLLLAECWCWTRKQLSMIWLPFLPISWFWLVVFRPIEFIHLFWIENTRRHCLLLFFCSNLNQPESIHIKRLVLSMLTCVDLSTTPNPTKFLSRLVTMCAISRPYILYRSVRYLVP